MTDQKVMDDIESLEKSAKVDSKMESGGYLDMNPSKDDIESLEKSAKMDSKMESGGYLDMNPSLTGTSESM
mgnify:CR=1 FL=1